VCCPDNPSLLGENDEQDNFHRARGDVRGWAIPGRTIEVTAYVTPADKGEVRAVLATDARDLLDVLGEAQRTGFVVDHIYDY